MITDILLLGVLLSLMVFGLVFVSEDRFDPLAFFTYAQLPFFFLRPAFLLLDMDETVRPFLMREDPKIFAREALIVFIIAYAGFMLGYAMKGGAARQIAKRLPGSGAQGVYQNRLTIVTGGGVLVSLAIVVYFRAQFASAADFIYEARHGLFEGMHALRKIPEVSSLLAALLFIVALRRRRGRLLAGLALVAILGVTLSLGDRSVAVYTFLAGVVCYHLSIRRVPILRLAGYFGAAAVLVFALGIIRHAVFTEGRDKGIGTAIREASWSGATTSAQEISIQLNLTAVDNFMVVLQDFDADSYHWGEDFLTGIAGVIPRPLWPGKPATINLGGWWRDRYMPGTGGKPFTSAGTLWLNFGPLGVFLGFLLSGIIFRGVWSYVRGTGNAPWAAMFYMVLILRVFALGVIVVNLPTNMVFWVLPLAAVYRYALARSSHARKAAPSAVRVAQSPIGNHASTSIDPH